MSSSIRRLLIILITAGMGLPSPSRAEIYPCGSVSAPRNCVPIQGVVTYAGSPVAGINVQGAVIEASGELAGWSDGATSDSNGNFSLVIAYDDLSPTSIPTGVELFAEVGLLTAATSLGVDQINALATVSLGLNEDGFAQMVDNSIQAESWSDENGNTIIISRQGAILTYLVNGQTSVPGFFKAPGTLGVFVPSGTRAIQESSNTGIANFTNHTIEWSDGSIWTPMPKSVPNLPAAWTDEKGDSILIVQSSGVNLTYDLLSPSIATRPGFFKTYYTLGIQGSSVTGTYDPSNKTIRWTNGTVWTAR